MFFCKKHLSLISLFALCLGGILSFSFFTLNLANAGGINETELLASSIIQSERETKERAFGAFSYKGDNDNSIDLFKYDFDTNFRRYVGSSSDPSIKTFYFNETKNDYFPAILSLEDSSLPLSTIDVSDGTDENDSRINLEAIGSSLLYSCDGSTETNDLILPFGCATSLQKLMGFNSLKDVLGAKLNIKATTPYSRQVSIVSFRVFGIASNNLFDFEKRFGYFFFVSRDTRRLYFGAQDWGFSLSQDYIGVSTFIDKVESFSDSNSNISLTYCLPYKDAYDNNKINDLKVAFKSVLELSKKRYIFLALIDLCIAFIFACAFFPLLKYIKKTNYSSLINSRVSIKPFSVTCFSGSSLMVFLFQKIRPFLTFSDLILPVISRIGGITYLLFCFFSFLFLYLFITEKRVFVERIKI